jgi:fatty-acyl-CoA synthase
MTSCGTIADALMVAAARKPVEGAGSVCGIRTIEHDGRTRSISYDSLLRDALRLGAALHAHGLEPGDRVAVVLPEVHDFIRAFFGITTAGLVPLPLCPPAQAGDVPTFTKQSRHILRAGRTSAVITSADVAPLLDPTGLDPAPTVLAVDALRDGTALSRPVAVAVDAPALLQFTSGSTAAPKGVVLTHRNLYANISAILGPSALDVQSTDVGVSWLPLYHDMGLIGMLLSAVYSSNDIVVMSPVLFLKRPTAWLEAISTYRGTVSFAPNFAYELCLRRMKPSQVESLDLSCWRAAGCGAEPVRSQTLSEFATRFAPAGFRASSFIASYGLAEHSLAVAFGGRGLSVDLVDAHRLVRHSIALPCGAESPASVRLVGCGRAFPGHEIAIVDDKGNRLPERHVGTITARGPSVMQGYFDDEIATAATLQDGWLLTGDLGYLADGQLFVCGRTKDLIIRQGRKYHPPDLESAIADLPGMRPSGVVVLGISRVDEADEIVAVLEARASQASDEVVEQVRRRVRETAGLELDRVVVTPPGTIPRTTSGKVRRAETRDRLQAGTLLAKRSPDGPSV